MLQVVAAEVAAEEVLMTEVAEVVAVVVAVAEVVTEGVVEEEVVLAGVAGVDVEAVIFLEKEQRSMNNSLHFIRMLLVNQQGHIFYFYSFLSFFCCSATRYGKTISLAWVLACCLFLL